MKKLFILLLLLPLPAWAEGMFEKPDMVMVEVTSYERTAREQAIILKKDYAHGRNLKRVYKDQKIIGEILKVIRRKNSLPLVEEIILKYYKKGRTISRHLCGQGIDISKRGKNVRSLILFFKKLDDVKVLDEGDHYHIQTISECK